MWLALRRLIAANPMGIFLWTLIAKWYVIIAVASLIVLFWVVTGLGQIGFINYMANATAEVLNTTKAAAQNCIPKLGPRFANLTNFWECLGNPPPYVVRDDITKEKTLEETLEKILPKDKTVPEMVPYNNPYDAPDNPQAKPPK